MDSSTDSSDMKEIYTKIQALSEELCRDDNIRDKAHWNKIIDQTYGLVEGLEEQNGTENNSLSGLEASAVNVWNYAVALKSKGAVSSESHAKLRSVAFGIVSFCSSNTSDETVLKKQISMGIKTGRAWYDCNQPSKGRKILDTTHKCVEKLRKKIIEKKNEASPSQAETFEIYKLEVEKDLFKVLCYKAEMDLAMEQYESAVSLVVLAKELLSRMPKEGGFLSMLCYNFGVDTFQRKQYEYSVMWLRESFELGKGKTTVGAKNQARTLRLLANAYLEWNPEEHIQKALNAVSLANNEHPLPAGYFMKLRILILAEESIDVLQNVLGDMLKHPESNIDLLLNAVQLLKEHKRFEMADKFLQTLSSRYRNSPEFGKIAFTHLELLITAKDITKAKEMSENLIIGHNTGKLLDDNIKRMLHLTFWEQAANFYEENMFYEALEWYNYSLSLFSPNDKIDENYSKLQRNRTSCFLNLDNTDKAMEAIDEAVKYEGSNVHTQFLVYKIALQTADNQKASASLQRMIDLLGRSSTEDDESSTELICLAAQIAFEKNNYSTACSALSALIMHSKSNKQVLTSIRCLIRLKLTSPDPSKTHESPDLSEIAHYIETAYNKLLILSDEKTVTETTIQDEATWFLKVAWNCALQCEADPVTMKELFKLCCQMSGFCPDDPLNVSRKKSCLMMSAAGCLQAARMVDDKNEKRNLLEEALVHIGDCHSLSLRFEDTRTEECKNRATTEKLLLVYEFEARVKLGDDANSVLEKALTLPYADSKTFETIAALSMEEPARNKKVCARALKAAIHQHLQQEEIDYDKCSKIYHSLVQINLSDSNTDQNIQGQAWSHLQEVCDFIDKTAKAHYPEIEIVWLMTKAWNKGIHFFTFGKYTESEKWCGMGMKLLQYLRTLRESYEDQMTNVYGEIMSKMENNRSSNTMEE